MKQFSSNCMSRNPGPHWSVQPLIGRETFRFFVENPEIAWPKSRQNFQTTNRAAKCRPTFEYRHATQIPRISIRERSISTSKPSSARPRAGREGRPRIPLLRAQANRLLARDSRVALAFRRSRSRGEIPIERAGARFPLEVELEQSFWIRKPRASEK